MFGGFLSSSNTGVGITHRGGEGGSRVRILLNLCTYLWDSIKAFLSLMFSLCTYCSNIFVSSDVVTLDSGRRVKIGKLLAEGGYSFVYEAREISPSNGNEPNKLFALKRILCQSYEQVKMVHKEVNAHKSFSHINLMPLLDTCCIKGTTGGGGSSGSNPDPSRMTFYLLFPYAPKGSLRKALDKMIDANNYELSSKSANKQSQLKPSVANALWNSEAHLLQVFLQICYGVRELHYASPVPLVHRDLKPDNILLMYGKDAASDTISFTPVIIDFGSMAEGNVVVTQRKQALFVQDEASQFCTISYRAPELFDVPSNIELDCRTDVWSLGCTLFAMAFGYSPFECDFHPDTGKPRVVEVTYLRVMGKIPYPPRPWVSKDFVCLINWVLQLDHIKRPTIDELIISVQTLLDKLLNQGTTTRGVTFNDKTNPNPNPNPLEEHV